jgi:hypothetical protein
MGAKEFWLRDFRHILLGEEAAQELAARDAALALRDAVQQPRRVRRQSPRTIEKQVGRPFVSLTDHWDGSRTYAFSQPEAAKEAERVEEPPRVSLFKARLVPKQKVIL